MQKLLCLVSVILVSGFGGVDSLQCYVCYNCTNPTEADLRTCGVPDTTVPPPQTIPATPVTTLAPAGTTLAPAGTTLAPAETTLTPAGTTLAPAGTTLAPAETTQAPADTTLPPADTTPEETPDPPGPQVRRSKRNVLTSKTNNDGCNCKNEADCECAIDVFSNRISQYADDESYLCYRITGQDNGVEVIARGCVPALMGGMAPCDIDLGPNVESCSTCDTDRCNGSFSIQYSAFLLSAAISLMLFK